MMKSPRHAYRNSLNLSTAQDEHVFKDQSDPNAESEMFNLSRDDNESNFVPIPSKSP